MLNTSLKKNAISKLKVEIERHKIAGEATTTSAIKLHESRKNSVSVSTAV